MRIAGSGCVSPDDLEAAWPGVQAAALRALVLDECARPDGRGLLDLRPLRLEARPPGSASVTWNHPGPAQVSSRATLPFPARLVEDLRA